MKLCSGCSLVLALALLAAPLVVDAQQAKVPKIGVLTDYSNNPTPCLGRLRLGLSELGYVEGRTHVLELRWAEGRTDLFSSLAADLVRLKVDLIVSAVALAAVAVKEATTSIPVVLASSFYPIELGVIASLARPGGNITGVTHFTPELMGKRVQLLKDVVPGASRIAVLRLPGHIHDLVVRDMAAAASQLGAQLQVIEVRRVEDLPAAFDAALARDDDHGDADALGDLPQLADEGDAVHRRHVPVGEDEVDPEVELLELAERLEAVLRLDHVDDRELVQDLELDLAREHGVVDEQDLQNPDTPARRGRFYQRGWWVGSFGA